MQVETFDKRRYAFGVTWITSHIAVAEDIASERKGATDGFVYYIDLSRLAPKGKGFKKAPAAEQDAVVGFVVLDEKAKTAPCAYAAGLAFLKQDGLFVALMSDGQLWYCGIRNGLVIPGTDVIGGVTDIRTAVTTMSAGLDLIIYAGHGVDIPGAKTFDLATALNGLKCQPLQPVSTPGFSAKPLLVVALLAGIGFVGYHFIFSPKPKLTPAQQQELARQSYIASVKALVKDVPLESLWVRSAYKNITQELPPYITGWSLEGVTCTPTSCAARYATSSKTFAYSPLLARFGKYIHLMQDGHSASVILPQSSGLTTIDEPFLRSLQVAAMPLLDWVGSVPVLMGGAKVEGSVLDNDLGQQFNAVAAAMPPLTMEEVSVKGDTFLDPILLQEVTAVGSRGGFVPVQFTWSYGDGKVPASWRMTWMRLHG